MAVAAVVAAPSWGKDQHTILAFLKLGTKADPNRWMTNYQQLAEGLLEIKSYLVTSFPNSLS